MIKLMADIHISEFVIIGVKCNVISLCVPVVECLVVAHCTVPNYCKAVMAVKGSA